MTVTVSVRTTHGWPGQTTTMAAAETTTQPNHDLPRPTTGRDDDLQGTRHESKTWGTERKAPFALVPATEVPASTRYVLAHSRT